LQLSDLEKQAQRGHIAINSRNAELESTTEKLSAFRKCAQSLTEQIGELVADLGQPQSAGEDVASIKSEQQRLQVFISFSKINIMN